MSFKQKSKRFFKLAWAVVKGFALPVTVALCIVLYGAFANWQPSQQVKDGLKSFFAVLFFIMFFFGQYKRVEKQTDDKDSFKAVSDQLLSLEDLVRKIRPTHAVATTSGPIRVAASDSYTLLAESKVLLGSGHPLAALLQAGVAFEHALRSFGRHFKGEETARLPLSELIKRIAPPEMAGELHALRQIRNRLTHISEHELSDLPDTERVLAGYEWAISELARILSRESAT